MNKQEAIARLSELEAEVAELENETAELRKIIEAPESGPSLLTKPEAGSGETFWRLGVGRYGAIAASSFRASSANEEFYSHGNIIQSGPIAAAYADAITCMLLLRHQPGTVAVASTTEFVWQICAFDAGIRPHKATCSQINTDRTSPFFTTEADAQRAIDTIGADRILRMFKTFHGIYE